MPLLPKSGNFGWIAPKAWINVVIGRSGKKKTHEFFFTKVAPKDPKVAALFWRVKILLDVLDVGDVLCCISSFWVSDK
jgi:hypothetical protein